MRESSQRNRSQRSCIPIGEGSSTCRCHPPRSATALADPCRLQGMPPPHECSGDRHYSCASRFANENERTRENAGAPTDADRKAVGLIHGMAVCFAVPGLHAHFGPPAVKNTRTTNETPALDDTVLPEFLRSREAAGLLRMSEQSFKRCRAEGAGPVPLQVRQPDCLRPGGPRRVGGGAEISIHRRDAMVLTGARPCRDPNRRDSGPIREHAEPLGIRASPQRRRSTGRPGVQGEDLTSSSSIWRSTAA